MKTSFEGAQLDVNMKTTTSLLAVLANIASLHQVSAYFILQGRPLVVERIDPIVSPGKVASHVHNIVGVSSKRVFCSHSIDLPYK